MWQIDLKKSVLKDLAKIKKSGLTKQFDDVYKQLKVDPYSPTQRFEKLKPPVDGKYSRRVNGQHRVVYQINNETKIVTILSAYGHYE
ncbi:MAG: Txe/YoeB family addiction module toxin [Leuconostoc pseudomesenteroides]|uniref:Txe/YoeB family addiction module toxin n=1 Tax=Leuconostoc TaxID=1243 RepID=UPI001E3B445D|nr:MULTISPECIES: Txe/YoeB family addiction module toxin [Leuconostoc]MCC7668914.1 Txe/YoeB family addiction module toxin [Leuconostoc pseudomesenteroides]MDI6666290.1 Txe/YoeB family addiction module toxin [Leuconostoc falkenbergense]